MMTTRNVFTNGIVSALSVARAIANLYDRAETKDRNDMQYRVQAQMDF